MQRLIHKNLLFLILAPFICLLSGCGTTSDKAPVLPVSTQTNPEISHKIAIVNASKNIINTIKYKPCGSQANHYQYLTGNLRPADKFTINIYSQCVDLMATNAFKKKLVDVKNVNLETTKTWTIK